MTPLFTIICSGVLFVIIDMFRDGKFKLFKEKFYAVLVMISILILMLLYYATKPKFTL
jgi:hypothetical protein